MNSYITQIITQNFIKPLTDFLEKEKNIKLSQSELNGIFKFSNSKVVSKVVTKEKSPAPAAIEEGQCIYIFQKKAGKKGERCTKKSKYYGYCGQHKSTVKAKKDIELRKKQNTERNVLQKTPYVSKGTTTKKTPKPKKEKNTIIEPSNPNDLPNEEEEEIHLLYKGDIDLYVRPKLKHILALKESDDGPTGLIFLYKYKSGKWEIPSENEINSMDTVDDKYVPSENYSKLDPSKAKLDVKSGSNTISDPFYTKEILKELGLN